jgi:hypothetical protein
MPKEKIEESRQRQINEMEADDRRIVAPNWYFRNRVVWDLMTDPGKDPLLVRANWLHVNILLLGLFVYTLNGCLLAFTRSGRALGEQFGLSEWEANEGQQGLYYGFGAPVAAEVGAVMLGLISRIVAQSTSGDYYVPQGVFAVGLHALFMSIVPAYLLLSWVKPASVARLVPGNTASYPSGVRSRGIARRVMKAFLTAMASGLGTLFAGWIGGVLALLVATIIAAFTESGSDVPPPTP